MGNYRFGKEGIVTKEEEQTHGQRVSLSTIILGNPLNEIEQVDRHSEEKQEKLHLIIMVFLSMIHIFFF